ncbi:MAG: methylmalonyl-CoA mutase family protein [Thermodesulfobacteriota bacterium]|jgi:methylmalonyl-CoA mutase, N-terminal domain
MAEEFKKKSDKKGKGSEEVTGLKETNTGIKVKLFYDSTDIPQFTYETSLGNPGQYPYTRGIYPSMYRGRLWTMRQYAGFSTSENTNSRFKFLLNQGQTGLSLALDLPTQLGLDSNDPLAKDDVGKLGVAIDTLKDMEEIFEGIPLDQTSTSFTINATASILLAMYVVTAEKQGVSSDKLRGTIQNDIIKEYIARGTYIFPPEPSIRLIGDTIEYCIKHVPKFNSVSVSGTHICECGATPAQGVAYPFLTGIAYIQEVLNRGYPIDDIAPLLSFHLIAGGVQFNFFQDIAKLRAARRLWAKILKERFNSKSEKSMQLKFSTGGMGGGMTEQQPLNNIARISFYALAAALAGSQSMNLPCFDEAYAIPTDEAIRTSLRIQQIIAYEMGIPDVVDPLGGSYYIESLTDFFEKEIIAEMERIDAMGGILRCVEDGAIQKQLAEQAYQVQKKFESGEMIKVGVNRFRIDEEDRELEVFEVDPKTLSRQLDRLKQIKAERDNVKVESALNALKNAAIEKTNLMSYLIDAVRAYATVGEIVSTLKDIYGEAQHLSVF